MFLELNKQTKGDIEKFPEIDDGTWPVIFDEFMEFYEQNKNK